MRFIITILFLYFELDRKKLISTYRLVLSVQLFQLSIVHCALVKYILVKYRFKNSKTIQKNVSLFCGTSL